VASTCDRFSQPVQELLRLLRGDGIVDDHSEMGRGIAY